MAKRKKMLQKLKEKGFGYFSLNDWTQTDDKYFTFNYFTIMWSGPSELTGVVNDQEFKMAPNHLLFLSPNKTIKINSKESEGIGLNFTSDFFERSTAESALLYNDLFFNESHDFQISQCSISIENFYNYFIDRLNYCFGHNENLFFSIAHNLTESLILEGISSSDLQLSLKKVANDEHILSNKFLNLLQVHYKTEKKVSFYADELNLTSRSLNKALNNTTQKTAKQFIIEKLIRESKKLLKFSNLPIYNIAWELGFTDEGNFSAFFKKHTELSPYEFKNKKKLENSN